VFFTPDSTFTIAQNLRVVDFANSIRYQGNVDTAAILAEARASREAVRKGMPSFVSAKRQFAPLSVRSDGDSIEVWLLPAGLFLGNTPTVGGERGFVFSPDGRTLARESMRPLGLTNGHSDSGRVEFKQRRRPALISRSSPRTFRMTRVATWVGHERVHFRSSPGSSAAWLQIHRR
jgi:hypothetical protein